VAWAKYVPADVVVVVVVVVVAPPTELCRDDVTLLECRSCILLLRGRVSIVSSVESLVVRCVTPQMGSVYAEDHMDDGSPICLTLTIDRKTKTAEFDFTGTGPEVRSSSILSRVVAHQACD
jgi:hypothetical protein